MLCAICGHRKRREIDRALLEKRPLRHTAAQFSTSTGALQRHRAHIHRDLVEAQKVASRAEQFARADSLLADLRMQRAGRNGYTELLRASWNGRSRRRT